MRIACPIDIQQSRRSPRHRRNMATIPTLLEALALCIPEASCRHQAHTVGVVNGTRPNKSPQYSGLRRRGHLTTRGPHQDAPKLAKGGAAGDARRSVVVEVEGSRGVELRPQRRARPRAQAETASSSPFPHRITTSPPTVGGQAPSSPRRRKRMIARYQRRPRDGRRMPSGHKLAVDVGVG
jgi:hypothetical protein